VEKTAAPDTEASQLGDELFEKHCKVCHGADGKGDIGPSLIDKEWKYGGSDDDLYYSIAKGRSSGMPNWDHTLNEENIRLIIEYIRSIGEE
jgi:cytochrome c oxidase cbb3-type subunit 3